ncbi:hypothetical protein BH24ACT20_BH24ACT20_02950 [soil metagenome]
MEGPYRDLGAGFARLAGPEGVRRSPSRISFVEDALLELLRNSRDAGARNIYVASVLHHRRYRNLTVLDDGCGIPDSHRDLIFEPGVTTRHLDPVLNSQDPAPHGSGLSLYHLKNAAVTAEVASTDSPTSITATFDTLAVPERSLQSGTRNSQTNLLATLRKFLESAAGMRLYYSSPARILATLQKNRIIQNSGSHEVRVRGEELGLEVSLRTAQRIKRGEIETASAVSDRERGMGRGKRKTADRGGARVSFGSDETGEIEAILRRIVRSRYLGMGDLRFESRPGEVSFRAEVYELEEEYE